VPADGRGLLLAWRRWQRLRQQVQQQLPAFIDGMVRMVVLGHATRRPFCWPRHRPSRLCWPP
jgi:hypothetical protein